MASASWEQKAADKRDRLAKTIPPEWTIDASKIADEDVFTYANSSGLLSQEEIEITSSSATLLVKKLAAGEWKAVDVTLAFCKRAALAHQLTNCALELFPETALVQAVALDEYLFENKKPVGPLHGLPISLKDQCRVKGYESSMGYISWLGKYDETDAVIVQLLRKAGAVFYVKTSVPQTLMSCETFNNIIGRTVNPRSKKWSCGGSSGGEGAMLALRGAPLGVGTDIGGSIRVPSAFNFLYGVKPSHGRLPYARMANSMEGQETVHSVVGPMGHSVEDLRLFFTSLLSTEPWNYDSKVIPLPWRTEEESNIKTKITSPGGLTIGFYSCDGYVQPHPPILRGISTVVSTLQQNGHTVVPWSPHRHDYGFDLINRIYVSDGSADLKRDIDASGEPAIPHIQELLDSGMVAISQNQLWALQLEKWQYQMAYLEAIRKVEEELGKELDAIVAPVAPSAAILHDEFKYVGYTSVVNLLDFSSVVVPVTFADRSVDERREGYQALNELDRVVQDGYDPEAYHGAPVAVQVIGRRLTEEKTLAIAEEIGRLLGNAVVP